MDCWWVVDEWRTQRTYREVNSSALTCEELHYTSITTLARSLFPTGAAGQYGAATISSSLTGLELWFNHDPVQKHITPPSLAYRKSCEHFGCNTDCNLIPFQSILLLMWSLQKTLPRRMKDELWKGSCAWFVLNRQTAAPSVWMEKKEKGRRWLNSVT